MHSAIIRRSLLAAATMFALSAASAPLPSQAQEETTADVVAARVQTFYDQNRTIEARFTQHFWNRVYARTDSSRGRLSIQRPGRIRFDYERPAGNVTVSNGTTWTLYTAEDNQYASGDAARASTSALGFLMGTARLTDFRRSLRARSTTQPAGTDALELRPRRPDPHYVRLVVYVGNTAATLGAVVRVSIEDADGNWNRFDFAEFRFNRSLAADLFTFTPPAGAREITGPRASATP